MFQELVIAKPTLNHRNNMAAKGTLKQETICLAYRKQTQFSRSTSPNNDKLKPNLNYVLQKFAPTMRQL